LKPLNNTRDLIKLYFGKIVEYSMGTRTKEAYETTKICGEGFPSPEL